MRRPLDGGRLGFGLVVFGLGALLVGCGGGDQGSSAVGSSTSPEVTTAESTTTMAPSTTETTEDPMVSVGLGEIALPDTVWDGATQEIETDADSETCPGVDDVNVAHPSTDYQLFMVTDPAGLAAAVYALSIYAGVDEASEAFDYSASMSTACAGWVDEDGSEAYLAPGRGLTIDGSDRALDRVLIMVGDEFSLEFSDAVVQVRNVLIEVGADDPALLPDLAQRLADRANGIVDDSTISVDPVAIGPGFDSPDYWVDPPVDLAALQAAADESWPGAAAWLPGQDNADIIALTGQACASANVFGWPETASYADLDLLVGNVLSTTPSPPADPDTLGQVFGAILYTHCPYHFEQMILAIDRLEG